MSEPTTGAMRAAQAIAAQHDYSPGPATDAIILGWARTIDEQTGAEELLDVLKRMVAVHGAPIAILHPYPGGITTEPDVMIALQRDTLAAIAKAEGSA